MTGEVTLQGRVLPIGGLKQKVLAAHAAGLTDVILPERNRADLDDVPDDVARALSFHPVMTLDEVLEHALEPAPAHMSCRLAATRCPRRSAVPRASSSAAGRCRCSTPRTRAPPLQRVRPGARRDPALHPRARLRELEQAGVLERRLLDGRPPRIEYLLTPRGRALRVLVTALRALA